MFPINQNLGSLGALRNLNRTNALMQVQLARLSSGLRITRAADDPAGLIISEQLRAQAAGIGQAIENTQSAHNVAQVAEGARSAGYHPPQSVACPFISGRLSR